MDRTWKTLIALPLLAVMAGCVAGGGGGNTAAENAEATFDDVDLDGDGSVSENGVELGQVN